MRWTTYIICIFSEGEDAELIVKKHIALLHLYNETKDATQVRSGNFLLPERNDQQGFFLNARYWLAEWAS